MQYLAPICSFSIFVYVNCSVITASMWTCFDLDVAVGSSLLPEEDIVFVLHHWCAAHLVISATPHLAVSFTTLQVVQYAE